MTWYNQQEPASLLELYLTGSTPKMLAGNATTSQLHDWRAALPDRELNGNLPADEKLWKENHGIDAAGDHAAVVSLSQTAP